MKNINAFILSLFITMGFCQGKVFAQNSDRSSYKDFAKIETDINCRKNKKLTGTAIKPNGKVVQLELTTGKKENVAIFLNDELYAYDSIRVLDYADFDLGINIAIPDPAKRYCIYVYFENSKTYLRLPYKKKYYSIRVHEPIKGKSIVVYSNSVR